MKNKAQLVEEVEQFVKNSDYVEEGKRHELREALLRQVEEATEIDVEKYAQVTSKFLEVSLIGMAEDFDPRAMLREISYPFLVLMRESFSDMFSMTSPAHFVHLEIMFREKKIVGDWSFVVLEPMRGELRFTAATPISFLNHTFTVPPDGDN